MDDFQRGEQDSWKFLFMGAMQVLRNPTAHRLDEYDLQEALEILCFLSILHRRLDQMRNASPASPPSASSQT